MKLKSVSNKRLAVITTHPQYYQVPIFQKIKKKKLFNLDVYYASDEGGKISNCNELGRKIIWDIPLLKSHDYFIARDQKKHINSFFLSFSNLKKFLAKKKYNAVLILGWNNVFYLKSFFLALVLGIPMILRVETNNYRKVFFIKKIIKSFFLFFYLKCFDYFLYIGKKNKKFYQNYKILNNKLFYAPYSVDNNFYFEKNKKLKLFEKNFNPHKKKIILFIGKLIERKNPKTFLDLALAFKNNNDLLFILVGDGNLMSYCKNYIKDHNLQNIQLVGFKNRKEIRDIYKISYLLVLPSKYETWGLVVNEAMACKLPAIVSSSCGCADDLIKNFNTGLVYKEGDFLDLKDKFVKLIKNKILYSKIKSNLLLNITKYNFDVTIKSLTKILNTI
jgi:glycosyltransferase involved in cell wall biosynthesis